MVVIGTTPDSTILLSFDDDGYGLQSAIDAHKG